MEQEEINKLPHDKIDKYLEVELKLFRMRCTLDLLSDKEYMTHLFKRISLNVGDIINNKPNKAVDLYIS